VALATVAGMRWDHLFDDLAGQLEHELEAEQVDLQHEEERLRLGRLDLRDRITALHRGPAATRRLHLRLRSGERVALSPMTVGRDWVAGDLDDRPHHQAIVPFHAIDSVQLDREQVAVSLHPGPEGPQLAARLGLGFLLRDLCRRRAPVTVVTDAGPATGTIDRVGRDHVDLAVHELDVPRRNGAVDHVRLIRLAQVLVVRL